MNECIRVLNVFAGLDRCGAETMCMNIYRNLDRQKVQFDFVKHVDRECEYEDEIRALGGKVYLAPTYKVVNVFNYERWWKSFLTNHPEYKLIHGHYFSISAIYFKVAKSLNRITIAHSHIANQPMQNAKTVVKRLLEKQIPKYADYRLACSEAAGRFLYGNRNFIVLRNGIEVALYRFDNHIRTAVRQSYGFEEDDFVIGAVGRLEPQKNPQGIVEIFSRIKTRLPNAKLLWIGDGSYKLSIKSELTKKGIVGSVIMPGSLHDINRQLQAMDYFIFPSIYEGLGIAAIEAQATGLRCLCSKGVPEEVGVTDLCCFLDLDDLDAWAELVASQIQLPRRDMTRAVGDAGYDVRVTSKWVEEFYLTIGNHHEKD